MSNELDINEYKDKLNIKIQEVKDCQNKNNIDDCLKCNQVIGCILRNEYVKAVYESMNKGKTGGFEF